MDKKAYIKSCHRQGYKYVEIAKMLGITPQRVNQILNPIKHNARLKVQSQNFGINKCQYPECKNYKTEAHHHNYEKPLEVTWLCKKHHMEFHKGEPKKKKVWKCKACLKELPNGHHYWCRDCKRKKKNKYRRKLYNTNPIAKARQKERNKAWRKANPEHWKKIINKAVRKYSLKNQAKINETALKNYHKNVEESRRKQREYYEKNKEHKRQLARKNYHKRKLDDLSTRRHLINLLIYKYHYERPKSNS